MSRKRAVALTIVVVFILAAVGAGLGIGLSRGGSNDGSNGAGPSPTGSTTNSPTASGVVLPTIGSSFAGGDIVYTFAGAKPASGWAYLVRPGETADAAKGLPPTQASELVPFKGGIPTSFSVPVAKGENDCLYVGHIKGDIIDALAEPYCTTAK